ncbi:iron ABC transporter permease [Blastococcus sp. CCUG 61487]|uniref:iron ABC transporter permease n=1 Tax=Blastococcus sp. CCUG 61487 TaxID=1840703 RepID=UPI0010C0E3F1|nr:iron ABC transporter permease [Blastococcus sp. CCUG 61487]TKJ20671.1 ABC transporter permease [Blastococcus sp. CCUG 61487]
MTQHDQALAQPARPAHPPSPAGVGQAASAAGAVVVLVLVVAAAAGWHLTQGTSAVGLADLVGLLTGRDDIDAGTRDVLVGSRIPRLAAGLAVGFALGVAGALFQSLARNALASPDTLAVTAGAHFAVSAVAAFGLAVPLAASGAVATAGGLAAAGLVLGLAGGGGTSTTRLVLAGTAVAMALQAATAALLLLFAQETTGLLAWGSGSLSQLGLDAFRRAAPVVVVATLCALLIARRLDLLGLGDDTAGVLGVPVRSTRVIGTVLAVLLTASAVTLAGPIGFVGLAAPVLARLMSRAFPALQRHLVLIPVAGLVGALVVVLADALLRAAVGADRAIAIPTGVTTTLLGAVLLVALARRGRDSGPTRQPPGTGVVARSRRRFWIVISVSAALVVAVGFVGLLAGNTWLRTGDLALWLGGEGSPFLRFVLDERAPRVAAALLAGAALALSGSLVQATCRNPLAEPGLLGITGGAGLGAVLVAGGGGASGTTTLLAASTGALVAFALVYGLAWRKGLNTDRLVLIGIGFWYGSVAVTTYLLLRANPFDTPRIFTFLAGTTYGRSWSQVLPVAVLLLIALPLAVVVRRELDLLALDDDTPRVVGVGLERVRLLVLTVAALLAATSVIAVGVVGFVGLVAPHLARGLVGGRHARSVPVSLLAGAALLGVADLVGRTVLAPAELPAGLAVALIGAPYFVYLLSRSRS